MDRNTHSSQATHRNSETDMNYLNATDYCPAAGTLFRESGGERGWCRGMNTARRVLDWGGERKNSRPVVFKIYFAGAQ